MNDTGNETLYVLHAGDIDKLVGTKARHPVCRLSVFAIHEKKLEKLIAINGLNQYCSSVMVMDTFLYVISPISFYLVRTDKNWMYEI